ncbi:hypothetical protein ERO13_D07G223650v2 [Gossypium hirsutum]|nr:hypothetical protein ERO13_D07G223650v2 [Gossypium hirsutum]
MLLLMGIKIKQTKFSNRNTEIEEEMLLDLHNHGIKEAIQLLKYHLTSLADILCNFLML